MLLIAFFDRMSFQRGERLVTALATFTLSRIVGLEYLQILLEEKFAPYGFIILLRIEGHNLTACRIVLFINTSGDVQILVSEM